MKAGAGAAVDFVRKSQEILQRSGIDPIFGDDNLVWAPNWQTHRTGTLPSTKVTAANFSGDGYAESVYNRLKIVVDEAGYDNQAIGEELKRIATDFIQGVW